MVDIHLIKESISTNFTKFSHSKKQEVERLVYEISKRENVDYNLVISDAMQNNGTYTKLKDYLLTRRNPRLSERERKNVVLTELNVDPKYKVDTTQKREIIPKRFYIEKAVIDTDFTRRLHENFPNAEYNEIPSYKEYVGKQKFGIEDYNKRLKSFFIVKESYDFFKRCACSPKSVYCGYHVVNLGSGCGFDCAYCYLQDYINSPGIILPANVEDFFNEFSKYKQDVRIGSGEITDSLIFDHITEFSSKIVNFFRDYPGSTFEFKTKGNNIDNLLKVKGSENIVVAWSMNPPEIIDSTEHYTASLEERLDAAEKCVAHGYRVAFHFDPMVQYLGWEKGYEGLVNKIFSRIDAKRIAWIGVGTLRMTPRLKKIIENRFGDSQILDGEFIRSYDGKLRYGFDVRTKMYTNIKKWIESHSRDVHLFLCMEEKEACSVTQSAPLKQYQ